MISALLALAVSQPEIVTTAVALVSALAGGGLGSVVVRRMDQEKVDLDLFYPTWKAEMTRIHEELASLREQVVLLSDEVRRLGGDPLAVRYPEPSTKEMP